MEKPAAEQGNSSANTAAASEVFDDAQLLPSDDDCAGAFEEDEDQPGDWGSRSSSSGSSDAGSSDTFSDIGEATATEVRASGCTESVVAEEFSG